MLSEKAVGGERGRSRGGAFWWRLTDNLFRRLVWFLLPVVALAGVGFVQAGSTLDLYRSSAQLSASSNPLIPEQPISGVTSGFWETAAGSTTRIINEQLGTKAFLDEVIDRAGLGEFVSSGLLDPNIVRASVWASANGDTLLSINAQWDDPQTAFQLVQATVETFKSFLTETVASDAAEAEVFWTTQLDSKVAARDDAREELDRFAAGLPELDEGEERAPGDQIELEALSDQLRAAEDAVDQVETNIDEAKLQQQQLSNDALRSIAVVDEAQVPGAPESTLFSKISTVVSFVLLGVVVAASALVVTTVLDNSVASPADLLALPQISLVATVPPTVAERRRARRRRAPTRTEEAA